jgi:hypothetical protein
VTTRLQTMFFDLVLGRRDDENEWLTYLENS